MTPEEQKRDAHIRQVVDAAPPLSAEQVAKLRRLLVSSPEAAAEIQARNAEVRQKLLDPGKRTDVADYDDYIREVTDKARALSDEQVKQIAAELAPVRERIALRKKR